MPKKKTLKAAAAKTPAEMPLLPLKDVVLFPNQVLPLFVGRPRSMAAVEEVSRSRQRLVLVAQKNVLQEDPSPDEVYGVGTTAEIVQVLRLPDGLRLIVEGKERVRLEGVHDATDTLRAKVTVLPEDGRGAQGSQQEAAARSLLDLFEEYVRLHPKLPLETTQAVAGIEPLGRLADAVAAHLTLRPAAKQALLEKVDPLERVEAVAKALSAENQVLALERQLNSRVRKRMEKHQREAWLQEQLRAIQQELGQGPGSESGEAAELREKLEARKLPKEAREKAFKELQRFERMAPLSAEATVVRTYLDWILALPWGKSTKDVTRFEAGRSGPGRGPRWAGQAQDPRAGVPGRAPAHRRAEGPHPVPGGPPGRGQDQPGPQRGPRPGPQVRARVAGRRARRGRDPRPPPHLHRRPAGPPGAGPETGRQRQPGDPAGRAGQDGRGLPRRPRPRPCWRSWTRSRTTPSATTTWTCPWI